MRRAIITGGTSGIGKALAELLKKKKYDVRALGSRDANLCFETGKVIDLIHEIKPDLVVNSAGFGRYGDAIDIAVADQMEMIDVLCKALMEITLETAKLLVKEGRSGTILNVSSIAGHFPMPGLATYGAAKAFVTHFSEAVDFELRPKGVRVLASCPGMVETNFASRAAGKNIKIGGRMSPTFVAHRLYKQIERGQGVDSFPKWHLFPKWLLKPIIYRSIKNRL